MPESRSFSIAGNRYYLLDVPAAIGPDTVAIVALHGFSSTPETMLRLMRATVPDAVICALEGPNQFYTSARPDAEVGFGWGTRARWSDAVRLHHDMVGEAFEDLDREFRFSRSRRILAGFSQPVSLNYRFAVARPELVRGVIGICGGIPKGYGGRTHSSFLHIARRHDEIYPEAVTNAFVPVLQSVSDDVEFHQLDGGHRFPSKAGPIVEGWLNRLR